MRTLSAKTLRAIPVMLLAVLLGCSGGGKSPATPDPAGQANPPTPAGLWGDFELAMDSTGALTINALERDTQWVVTPFVRVDLVNSQFDPATRIWDLEVACTNLTPFTGYGLWAAFYNLNGNTIVDQDGFITGAQGGESPDAPGAGQRKPVVAFGKQRPQRAFPGGATLMGHIKVRWPAGAEGWNGLRFYLDASFPAARQEPVVEELSIEEIPPICNIRAYVKDWQTNLFGMEVFAFIKNSPLTVVTPLKDDGVAPDLVAGDDIYSGEARWQQQGIGHTVVVKAIDSNGYHFENEIVVPGEGGGECLPYEVLLDTNDRDGAEPFDLFIRNSNDFGLFWSQHFGSLPPLVDFETFDVIAIGLEEFPTGGHTLGIECIREVSDPAGGSRIEVHYTHTAPGEGCEVPQQKTRPTKVVKIVKHGESILADFHRTNQVAPDCPPTGECLAWDDIRQSQHNAIGEPFARVFAGENAYKDFFGAAFPGEAIPPVNFGTHVVAAIGLETFPTGGHTLAVECFKWVLDPAGCARLHAEIVHTAPGAGCAVDQVETNPTLFAVVARKQNSTCIGPELALTRTNRVAPSCPPTGDCEEYDVLRDSDWNASGPNGYTQLINGIDGWEEYWNSNFPGTARPSVNFEEFSVVAISLGQFNNTGHTLSVECVRRTTNGLMVEYTHHIPGEGCGEPAEVRPTVVLRIKRYQVPPPVQWIARSVTAPPCEPECRPVESLVDDGVWPNFKQGGYKLLINDAGSFAEYWQQAFPNEPPRPTVNFEERSVIAIGLENPAWSVQIACVRVVPTPAGGDALQVDYTIIPNGENCPPYQNKYYIIGASHKWTGPVIWNGIVAPVAPCDPPPACDEYDILRDGLQAPDFQQGTVLINSQAGLNEYWFGRYPGENPPQLNFENVSVIAINVGLLDVPRRPIIDCIRREGPNEILRVEWHREIINQECPFDDGNWGIVAVIPKWSGPSTFVQSDDVLWECR